MNRGQSGQWFRRGGNVVLVLGGSNPGKQGELEFGFESPYQKRVINSNIDVKAQKALLQMLNSGVQSDVVAAETLIDWVELGFLAGIFQPDQYVPAQAAKNRGGWWTMLTGGKRARVFCERPTSLPVLIFRKDLDRESLISIFRSVVRRDASTTLAACSISAGAFCGGGTSCETLYTF